MSLATRHDLTRDEIVAQFRQRIREGRRTKLTRNELDQLVQHFVDRLVQLQHHKQDSESAIRQLAETEIALLEEGYPQQSVSSQYLPTYRKQVTDAIETGRLQLTEHNSFCKHWEKRNHSDAGDSGVHFALHYLKYDLATYEELRQSTTANNNQRQDNLRIIALERYLNQVMNLLTSNDERRLAIAIAALTGRRHTEVISKGTFEKTRYPYMLRFSGQQKKAQPLTFDILTLVPAETVLEAIERFRQLEAIAPLLDEEAGHDDPRIDVLNTRINREVKKWFQDTGIVPVADGFKSVSIHRLRGIYGAIAIHYFCPEWKHEHRFLQHYLGHVLDGVITPNARATEHYFHYRLAKPDGTLITARGVKIPANGLPPLPETQPQPISQNFTEVEMDVAPPVSPTAAQPKPAVAIASDQAAGLAAARGLQIDAVTLEKWKRQRGINDRFWSLRDRYGLGFDFESGSWLDLWEGATSPKQPVHPPDALASASHQQLSLQLTEEDSKRILRCAAHQGITTENPLEALQHILERAEKPTVPDSTETLEAIAHQASTLAWLTKEIELLRAENQRLKEQSNSSTDRTGDTSVLEAQVKRLEQENKTLKHQLSRFETVKKAFLGEMTEDIIEHELKHREPAPVAPPQPEETTTSTNRRKGGRAIDRAKAIFDAIALWNQQHPNNAWAINASLLEREFGINRKAAKEFEVEYQPEIEHLHNLSGVENPSSHNRGHDTAALKQFVSDRLS